MKKPALIFLVGPYSASLYTTIGLGFKVSKMHSWVVKLVFYLSKSARTAYPLENKKLHIMKLKPIESTQNA